MIHENKIESLESKRDALEAMLSAKGLDKERELAIQQRIVATTQEITALYGLMTASVNTQQTPEKPAWQQSLEVAGLIAGCSCLLSGWWFIYPNYATWRHRHWKYSESQIRFRRDWFQPTFPELASPASKRLLGRIVVSLGGIAGTCLLLAKKLRSPPSPPPQK